MSNIKELARLTREISGREVNKLAITSEIASVKARIETLGPIRNADGEDTNNERRKARDKLRYLDESLMEVETEIINLKAERYIAEAVLEYGED